MNFNVQDCCTSASGKISAKVIRKAANKNKKALAQLAEDPFKLAGVKAMLGEWDGYRRMRVGDFIIFLD